MKESKKYDSACPPVYTPTYQTKEYQTIIHASSSLSLLFLYIILFIPKELIVWFIKYVLEFECYSINPYPVETESDKPLPSV